MERPRITLSLCLLIVLLVAINLAAFRYATTRLPSGEIPFGRMWAMYTAMISIPFSFFVYERVTRASRRGRSR